MKQALLAGTAAILAFSSSTTWAQEATDDVDDGEIIVTATRSETLLSKTPIAMSAFSGDDLIESGVSNPTQLADSVPNVSIVRGNGLQITIRGVTSTDGTEKGDPSAAFMLNGIYLARPQAQEVSFFDIERVEVLRGPQGTLYGRNSTAGVINVISARPKFAFSGAIDASYASFKHINGTAVINVPLGDTFAIRAAANIDKRDSYIVDGNDADGVTLDPYKDNKSLRLSALFEPTDDISLLLVGDYSTVKGNITNSVPTTNFYTNIVSGIDTADLFLQPALVDAPSSAKRLLPVAQGQQSFRDNEEKGVMGELNWGIGQATLTYLGAYRESERRDASNLALGPITADFRGSYWQTSHELRLAIDAGPLQAQLGGYYFKEKSGIAFFMNNLAGPNTRFGFPQDPTIAENKSVFGQATLEVAPDVKLTGGVRYSHDLKSRVGNTVLDIYDSVVDSYNIGDFITRLVLQDNDAKRNFSKVTWRAGIDYDSPLGLVFASVSTGYKAGGFNDGCEVGTGPTCGLAADLLYYNPETLTAYEAGFKFKVAPELRLNGTVFHYDYKGLQVSEVTDICGGPCQLTSNAAVAKVDGVELDAQVQPVDSLTIRLAINYLDARYDEYSPKGIDFSGRPLSRSPKWTWNAGVNYTIPVGDGSLVADAGVRFSSRYELTDLTAFVYFYQPSYTKTDLSLTYKAPEDRYYMGVYVENLENEVVATSASTGLFGSVTFADPRTFGVRAGAKF